MRVETIGNATLICGNCLDVVPTLDPVGAIITDPPYGNIRGDFDFEWSNRKQFIESAATWADVLVPAMDHNASLWWFAWPTAAGLIEAMLAERLRILGHIVWKKPAGIVSKSDPYKLRAPIPITERIIFGEPNIVETTSQDGDGYRSQCERLKVTCFAEIREYLANGWAAAGQSQKDADRLTGTFMASHWMTKTQWVFPAQAHYETLQAVAGDHLPIPYDELKKRYHVLLANYNAERKKWEHLRRPFNGTPGIQLSDVWEFNPPRVRHGHPTEKPVSIMDHIVSLSTRPDSVVLDPFMGSGTTGVACANLGRPFIGIELDPRYFEIAVERITQAHSQGRLFA